MRNSIDEPFNTVRCIVITLALLLPAVLIAQIGSDSSRLLKIIRAERYTFERKDSVTSFLSLAGNVALQQQGTLFYADSAVLNQTTNVVEAFGNIHINDGDSVHTYSKYLRYRGNEKQAYLRNNVRLQDAQGSTITTNELSYDLNTGIATYLSGGRVVNKKTLLTSKYARYYEGTKDVVFSGDVKLKDPEYDITSDSLQYNSTTEVATFIAPATIKTGSRTIVTRNGYYDARLRKAFFTQRASIEDSSYRIESNDMAFDDVKGLAQFKGNVIYRDTANGIVLLSEELFGNRETSSFLATQKPLMILKQEEDSIFISADSLLTGQLSDLQKRRTVPLIIDTAGKKYIAPDLLGKDSSQNRFFEAWYNVRIFSDSVQAIADSMFYAGTDSAFRLFNDPVVWSNNSQITADTMYMFTRNKKPHYLNAFFNGFIISRVEGEAFNQVRGNTVQGWFNDGNIEQVKARGRAESIYFAQDDYQKFVGMNRSTSDIIEMYFEDRKARRVKFISNLNGTTFPISQIPPGQSRLGGFNWRDNERPKTFAELLGR